MHLFWVGMIKKIEHIGIAVANLEESKALFRKLLGKPSYKEEAVQREGVITSFFECGESKLELLGSTSEQGVISKFIERKGQGIHHIALSVDNILTEITRLQADGFEFIDPIPKKGADNKLICFIHPKSCNGILVELCQDLE